MSKVNEPCEHCREEQPKPFYVDNEQRIVIEAQHSAIRGYRCYYDDRGIKRDGGFDVDISFCPICGRDLAQYPETRDNAWISVDEEMPKLGQRVLAYVVSRPCNTPPSGYITFVRCTKTYERNLWFAHSKDYDMDGVEFWHPFPKLPKLVDLRPKEAIKAQKEIDELEKEIEQKRKQIQKLGEKI